jgi:hypothetical protein
MVQLLLRNLNLQFSLVYSEYNGDATIGNNINDYSTRLIATIAPNWVLKKQHYFNWN